MPCKKITLPLNYTKAWSKDVEINEELCKAATGDAVAPKKRRLTKKILMEQRSSEVMKQFSMNYLCVKRVLEYCDWRDLNLLSKVCELWKEAADSVAKRKLSPCLFLLLESHEKVKTGSVTYRCSGSLKLEPMFIITFLNQKAAQKQFKCKDFQNSPCQPKCRSKHKCLDFIYSKLCYPSDCLLGIKCQAVVFNAGIDALSDSIFESHLNGIDAVDLGFLAGFALPKIPGVIFHKATFYLSHDENTIYQYYRYINNLLDNELVKCVMVFPSEVCYRSYHDQLSLAVNYLFGRQQSQSFAIGGSLVKAVTTDNFHKSQMTNSKVPDMLVMVLSVPKNAKDKSPNFEVFSLVVWQHPSNEEEIRNKIEEFASAVPRHRHSTALQFVDICHFAGCCDCDCSGSSSNDVYSTIFSSIFPHITLIGCCGEVQVGAAHPSPEQKLPTKYCTYEDHFVFDNRSCVFLYFTWGQ